MADFNIDEIAKKYVKNPWNKVPTEESVAKMGSAKVTSLTAAIDEIEQLIKQRMTLSNNFVKEADDMKADINKFLMENTPQSEDDSEFVRERSELRKKQIELSELQLNEKVNAWKDIALLKKELREREKELTEKKSRTELIKDILKEEPV